MLGRDNTPAPLAPPRSVFARLAALTALALALRLLNVSTLSLWEDEAMSVDFAGRPIAELVTCNADSGNPPGYYLMLKAWRALWGSSDFALRSLSILCGVLCVPAAFALARRLSGREQVAWGAAVLLTIAPRHIFYSQEVRAYVPIGLIAIVSTHALLSALRDGGWRRWGVYVLLAICAPYLHFQGFLLLLAQGVAAGLYLLMHRAPWRRCGAWAAAEAALALLMLPCVLLYFAPGFIAPHGYHYWQGYVTLQGVAEVLALFTIGDGWIGVPRWLGGDTALISSSIILVGALGPFLLLRARRGDYDRAAVLVVATVAIVGPAVFVLACLTRSVWQPKYLLAFQPLYLVVLAAGLFARPVRTPAGARALLAGVVLAALPQFLGDVFFPWRPDYRGLAAALEERNPDHRTPVRVHKSAVHAVRHYYGGPLLSGRDPQTDPPDLTDRDTLLRHATAEARASGSVFVVLSQTQAISPAELDDIERELTRSLRLRARHALHNLRLLEFEARGDTPPAAAPRATP